LAFPGAFIYSLFATRNTNIPQAHCLAIETAMSTFISCRIKIIFAFYPIIWPERGVGLPMRMTVGKTSHRFAGLGICCAKLSASGHWAYRQPR
jgi:hypothetical protein